MSLIRIQGAVRRYGANLIFGPLDLSVHPHDRIGLIGPNGSGKSSLVKMIAGEEPDEGYIHISKDCRIGYLQQELNTQAATLYDFVLTAFEHLAPIESRLTELEQKMATDEIQSDPRVLDATVSDYEKLIQVYTHDGGFERESRTKGALHGVGFLPSDYSRPLSTLSGGERARAQLAQVLLTAADVLLLDEPTNHLDIQAIEWLQATLARYEKSLVLVSHDRLLLSAVATTIWEMSDQTVVVYPGGYEASREMAAARRDRMQKDHEKDQVERAKLEAYVRKYRAGSRAAQAKSREKRLERMGDVAPKPVEIAKANIRIPSAPRSERNVAILSDVTLGYGTHPVISGIQLDITRGQRIAMVGPNGAGKSTLLKAIAGQIPPLRGHIHIGRGVIPLYYAQDRIDLPQNATVMDALKDGRMMPDGEARSFLARFLFRGDDVFQQVHQLSGGEKSRLSLARLLLSSGNLFLLDEPTNHLDLDMREVVQEALEDYDGTLLLITHDRALIQSLADKIWWVGDGRVHVIDGGYNALMTWLATQNETDDQVGAPGGTSVMSRTKSGKSDRRDRQRSRDDERLRRELSKRLEQLEADLGDLHEHKQALEGRLADPSIYDDPENARDITQQYAEVTKRLEELENEWIVTAQRLDESHLPT